jgi:hypothetical protein
LHHLTQAFEGERIDVLALEPRGPSARVLFAKIPPLGPTWHRSRLEESSQLAVGPTCPVEFAGSRSRVVVPSVLVDRSLDEATDGGLAIDANVRERRSGEGRTVEARSPAIGVNERGVVEARTVEPRVAGVDVPERRPPEIRASEVGATERRVGETRVGQSTTTQPRRVGQDGPMEDRPVEALPGSRAVAREEFGWDRPVGVLDTTLPIVPGRSPTTGSAVTGTHAPHVATPVVGHARISTGSHYRSFSPPTRRSVVSLFGVLPPEPGVFLDREIVLDPDLTGEA